MKCYKPIWIPKNGTVPCGRCMACRLNKASEWGQRMMHEKKMHKKTVFVTLTYSDPNLPNDGSLDKKEARLFIKRLRKKGQVRYYLSGEYGELSHRPHYHAILFGMGVEDRQTIEKAWDKGHVYCGDVTDDSCNYVAGYVVKKLTGKAAEYYREKGIFPEFGLMSRKPGIGGKYVERYAEEIKARGFNYIKGKKVSLPRFYKNQLYKKGSPAGDRKQLENDKFKVDERNKKMVEIEQIGNEFFKKQVDERLANEQKYHEMWKLKRRKL